MFATQVNSLLDAALTTEIHRDKTSVPGGTWKTPTSTPLTVAGLTTDLATCEALCEELRGVLKFHFADSSAHEVIDSVNLAFDGYMAAITQAKAILIANAMKLNYNSHKTQSTVHVNSDVTNLVTASAATDLNSLKTLLADIKTQVNLHMADAGLTQRAVYIDA